MESGAAAQPMAEEHTEQSAGIIAPDARVNAGMPRGIVVMGPAWVACGSYEVFRRQMACCRSLGLRTYFLAISPTWNITSRSKYWDYYYQNTTNLGADDRGHAARALNVLKFPELATEVVPGVFKSAAFWTSAHTRLMGVPDSLRAFIGRHQIDTVICHHYFDIPVAKRVLQLIPGAQLILETQDVQTNHYVSQKKKHPITRQLSSEQDMLRDEMEISSQADILIHYNDQEAAIFKEKLPNKRHVTIYPAFARNYLTENDTSPEDAFDFLIVASGNDPNYHSVRNFLRDVWIPALDGKRSLRIVGNIDALFKQYSDPLLVQFRDVFIGLVADLTPWYQQARYVLLPVAEGQGIAIKTLESLSYGKCVVATPLAYRGFRDQVPPSLAGEIVSSPQEFQQRLLTLDVTQPPALDDRTIALYEQLFTVKAQTGIYHDLLISKDVQEETRLEIEKRLQSRIALQTRELPPVESYETELGHLKRPGSMTPSQLRILEHFLYRHFDADAAINTVETGCGESTVLFSKYATTHLVYCGDDRGRKNSLTGAIRATKGFVPHFVTFVHGNSPATLIKTPAIGPIDIALIGGHHAAPDAEYMIISRHLRKNSILILRDIHVPTIRKLFEVLCEESYLTLTNVQDHAAFFWCGSAPGDLHELPKWWSLPYNILHTAPFAQPPYTVSYKVPFAQAFDGWLNKLPPYFKRGVMLLDGRPTTASSHVLIDIDLAEPVTTPLAITLDGQLVTREIQSPIQMQCVINGIKQGKVTLMGGGPQRLRFVVDVPGARSLKIDLRQKGIPKNIEPPAAEEGLQSRAAVFALHAFSIQPDIEEARPSLNAELIATDGGVVTFAFEGTPLSFFVHDRHDSIQAHHANGQLYETEELQLLAKHIAPGARILDIGANIGNHTVWFAKVAKASLVIPFEPQPRMQKHLRLNCALNELNVVDLSHLGCALGRDTGKGSIQIEQAFNPAGAVITNDPSGTVPIVRGDDLLGSADFDFVKIDTEGAEVGVIEGIEGLIRRCKPTLFVEVANENRQAFDALMQRLGYAIADEYRRYDQSTNLLLKPV